MYNVAYVHDEKCIAEKGCRLCVMYCPEADTILMDKEKTKPVVITHRCKGCDLCAVVCSTHKAISMHPVNPTSGEIILDQGKGQTAGLGQAYAG